MADRVAMESLFEDMKFDTDSLGIDKIEEASLLNDFLTFFLSQNTTKKGYCHIR